MGFAGGSTCWLDGDRGRARSYCPGYTKKPCGVCYCSTTPASNPISLMTIKVAVNGWGQPAASSWVIHPFQLSMSWPADTRPRGRRRKAGIQGEILPDRFRTLRWPGTPDVVGGVPQPGASNITVIRDLKNWRNLLTPAGLDIPGCSQRGFSTPVYNRLKIGAKFWRNYGDRGLFLRSPASSVTTTNAPGANSMPVDGFRPQRRNRKRVSDSGDDAGDKKIRLFQLWRARTHDDDHALCAAALEVMRA